MIVSSLQAAEWREVDSSTLYVEGVIRSQDFNQFVRLYQPDRHKRLIVKSGGGQVHIAAQIGMALFLGGLETIEVDTICGSSCANYFFPAAKRKVIRENSFVGWHGYAHGFPMAQIMNDFLRQLLDGTLTFEQYQTYSSNVALTEMSERYFVDQVGVPDSFYMLGKHIAALHDVDWWIPSVNILGDFGFIGIEGNQSPQVAAELGYTFVSDLSTAEFEQAWYFQPTLQNFFAHPLWKFIYTDGWDGNK